MKARLLKYWDRLRSSFWFVPAAMACLAMALALASVELDKAVGDAWLERLGWSYSGGAGGASQLLSTVAGSMIAIAGTVFSMTLVAMSLASSQLGPQLLRNFMRDTSNQVVLGTFVYCLLVLRTIRRADEVAFVPHLSVSIAVLLAMISIGVLIYFIHYVSVSIQADVVVARVGQELEEGIGKLFPGRMGQPESEPLAGAGKAGLPASFEREARAAGALEGGYLQQIDADALMALACQEDLMLRLERRPGHYLVQGQAIVMVWPGGRVDDDLVKRLNGAFVFGNQRTASQDVEFSFHQLVEIAVRALSPGINDPFTAVACVDRRLRLVAPGPTFAGIVDLAFNQIRQSSRSNPAVAIRLLDAIIQIASHVQHPQDAACLQRHAEMIVRGAREAVPETDDVLAVEVRFLAVGKALRQRSG
jgi:uncharacterized membrane protein